MWGWLLLAALLAVAWGVWRVFVGYPAPERPARVLSRRELATLTAVADSLFPPGGEIPPSGRQAGVAAYVDTLVEASHPRQRVLMRALFFLVEHGTLFFPAPGGPSGLRRFSALDARQRTAVLEAWQHSGIFLRRLVFTSLRALCTLGYFADPAVLRHLRLAPYAIDTPLCEADLLYPPIGASRSAVPHSRDAPSAPEPARPLRPDDPLLAGYAEERS